MKVDFETKIFEFFKFKKNYCSTHFFDYQRKVKKCYETQITKKTEEEEEEENKKDNPKEIFYEFGNYLENKIHKKIFLLQTF
jgi:hypothetical protein